MIRKLTCIECPIGCLLNVDVENCKVIKVSGNKCPKGLEYAIAEVEDPVRVLTSTVLAQRLTMKMVPVRTDAPIPKADMMKAMGDVKRIKITKPIKRGDVIVHNFAGVKVNLIATRDII